MVAVDITLLGLASMRKTIEKGRKGLKTGMRGKVREGAKVIRREMKAAIRALPKKGISTGRAEQAVRFTTRSRGDTVTARVGIIGPNAWQPRAYMKRVEWGGKAEVKEHTRTKPSGMKVSVIKHEKDWGRPRPWAAPAVARARPKVIKILGESLRFEVAVAERRVRSVPLAVGGRQASVLDTLFSRVRAALLRG